jgi:hypothetical protein
MEILVFYGMLAGNPKRKSSSGVPRRRSNQFGAERRWNGRVGRHRNRLLRPVGEELCLLDLGEASRSFAIAQRFLRSRRTPMAVPQRIQVHRTAAASGSPPFRSIARNGLALLVTAPDRPCWSIPRKEISHAVVR